MPFDAQTLGRMTDELLRGFAAALVGLDRQAELYRRVHDKLVGGYQAVKGGTAGERRRIKARLEDLAEKTGLH